jgi:uncharacterized protein YneF (UPF0154 family)
MRRLLPIKTLFLVLLAAGIGAVVALFVNQKQKFAGMSEEEIRAYLDQKLGSRMSESQVKQIQDAIVSAVKGDAAAAVEAAEKADWAAEVAEEAAEKAEDAAEEAEEAAEEAEEEAEEAIEEAIDES